jgi:hypothetical protein
MSGVHRLEAAEEEGLKEVTNTELKEGGVYSEKESSEKYGEEKK